MIPEPETKTWDTSSVFDRVVLASTGSGTSCRSRRLRHVCDPLTIHRKPLNYY